MKEKDGYVDFPRQQMILYVEKEDGKYGPLQTGSSISKNYLDDYQMKRAHLEASLREKVLSGEVSSVYYYMTLEDLTLSELAARTGIRKTRVKKHLSPQGFGKATAGELKKYAEVFNVAVPNMLQIVMLRKDDHYESLVILEEIKQDQGLAQERTDNPFVVVTKIENTGK